MIAIRISTSIISSYLVFYLVKYEKYSLYIYYLQYSTKSSLYNIMITVDFLELTTKKIRKKNSQMQKFFVNGIFGQIEAENYFFFSVDWFGNFSSKISRIWDISSGVTLQHPPIQEYPISSHESTWVIIFSGFPLQDPKFPTQFSDVTSLAAFLSSIQQSLSKRCNLLIIKN